LTLGTTAFTSTGLQNGETIGSVTLASTGAVATATVAGSPYAITPSAATGGTFTLGNYATTYNAGTLTVTQATPTITTWPTASVITYGQTLASSTLVGGAGSTPGTFAFTTPTAAPGAGTASQGVTFTPTDATDYTPATGSVSVTVSKADASVTLGGLTQTYNQAPESATATTNPVGLTVTFTYNGSSTVPTAAGSYTVIGTISDASYRGSATGTMTIAQALATVTLGSLTQTYDGSPKAASVSTSPSKLQRRIELIDGQRVRCHAGVVRIDHRARHRVRVPGLVGGVDVGP
jgi:hypothetical protein